MLHVQVIGSSNAPIPESMQSTAKPASVDNLPTLHIPKASSSPGHTKVTLRDYQRECVEAIHGSWKRGVKSPLVVLPTGSGKTIIAASLMDSVFGSRGYRSVFLAHRRELIEQTVEKIDLVTHVFTPRIGVVQGKRNELGRDITVASIQTLGGSRSKRRLQEFIDSGPHHLLICDEAHHAVSPQWTRVLNAMREAYPDLLTFGMTATPGRADGTALDSVFDEVVFERNLLDMIRDGYLVPPKGYHVKLGLNLDRVNTKGGDYEKKQLSKIMNQPMVNRAVVEAWCKYSHNRKTVLFAVDVAHAIALRDEFRDAGYKADHVDGKMKVRQRSAVLKNFRNGETKILVNCEIATEGFDEPSIECIQFARPTQSQALYIQCLGRGLRLYPAKTECIVIDCVGNSERHKPVQLASLAGFDPERNDSYSSGNGDGDNDDPIVVVPTVIGSNVSGHEIDITGTRATTKYPWVETKLGWVLQIPSIGYYLVAWSTKNQTKCTIRFYDQRPGRRKTPPVDVVAQPIDFQLAYGLVEAEMDRIFNARSNRGMVRRKDGSFYQDPDREAKEFDIQEEHELPEINFVDLEEGTEEELDVPDALMLRDAAWRLRPATEKQLALLSKLGVKKKSLPEQAGEASDLITILRIERDAKMRLPATHKQLAYLRYNELSIPNGITKGQAAQIIWKHRKATGR